jgi:hypothetical protein
MKLVEMKRLSFLTLIFAILSLIFFLALVFLRTSFSLYPLMSYQDALDLLTPLILIPIYWLMFKYASEKPPRLAEELAFLSFTVIWVLGHGMHLAANSINNLAVKLAGDQEIDILGTNIYALTYYYDERLSHYLWHIGILGMVGLLVYCEWRSPAGTQTVWWATLLGGIIYGFTYFCIFLEGQTILLGLPFALVFTLITLLWGRQKLANHPLLAFFFTSCLLATILFVGWGLYWGGFPEFSEVGLI